MHLKFKANDYKRVQVMENQLKEQKQISKTFKCLHYAESCCACSA